VSERDFSTLHVCVLCEDEPLPLSEVEQEDAWHSVYDQKKKGETGGGG
jgi:hypothetical protein